MFRTKIRDLDLGVEIQSVADGWGEKIEPATGKISNNLVRNILEAVEIAGTNVKEATLAYGRKAMYLTFTVNADEIIHATVKSNGDIYWAYGTDFSGKPFTNKTQPEYLKKPRPIERIWDYHV